MNYTNILRKTMMAGAATLFFSLVTIPSAFAGTYSLSGGMQWLETPALRSGTYELVPSLDTIGSFDVPRNAHASSSPSIGGGSGIATVPTDDHSRSIGSILEVHAGGKQSSSSVLSSTPPAKPVLALLPTIHGATQTQKPPAVHTGDTVQMQQLLAVLNGLSQSGGMLVLNGNVLQNYSDFAASLTQLPVEIGKLTPVMTRIESSLMFLNVLIICGALIGVLLLQRNERFVRRNFQSIAENTSMLAEQKRTFSRIIESADHRETGSRRARKPFRSHKA